MKNGISFFFRVVLCVLFVILTLPIISTRWSEAIQDSSYNKSQNEFVARAAEGSGLPKVGNSVTRELQPNTTDWYEVRLNSGQYLQLVIESKGLNASINLTGSASHNPLQVRCRDNETVALALKADRSDVYRLEIISNENHDHGKYRLTLEELRNSSSSNDYRISGAKLLTEGIGLMSDWKESGIRAAVEKFKSATSLFRKGDDPRAVIRTLIQTGVALEYLGEYSNALPFYQESLKLVAPQRESRTESEIRNRIGYAYLTRGDNLKAIGFFTAALELAKQSDDPQNKGESLNNLGEASYGLGKLQESLTYYQQAQPFLELANARQGQALTQLNIGYTQSDLGQINEALHSYNEALLLWEAARNERGKSITLTAIGRLHSRIGESQKALQYFDQAMQIMQSLGAKAEQGRILTGIGYVYGELGDNQQAVDFYNRAFVLFNSVDDYSGEVVSMYDAGREYFALGEFDKALDCYQRAHTFSKAAADLRLQSFELREIGRIFSARGNDTEALGLFTKALSYWRSQNDSRASAETLNLIGGVFERRGQWQQALAYYGDALVLSRKSEFRTGEVASLYNLARGYRKAGDLEQARRRIEEGIAVVEAIRSKVSSQDLRDSFFAEVRQQYDLYIDILMSLHKQRPSVGFNLTAFEVSERARARSLIELLAEARADIRQGVNTALLDQERSLQKALDDSASRHLQLMANGKKAAAEQIAKEIDDLSSQYDRLKAQIRSESPGYAALTQPQPIPVSQLQQALDESSMMLEYALGEERSYLWAVTRSGVTSFELPPKQVIEDAVRRFHDLLIVNQARPNETFEQRMQRIATANQTFSFEADSLSRMLLAPVTPQLGTKRLIIVPDGALQYIPFQSLSVPSASSDANTGTPLIVEHEIVNEPSAAAFMSLGDHALRPAKKILAMLADPVFESDDPRIKTPGSKTSESNSTVVKEALRDLEPSFDGSRVPRLLATRREAESIMHLIPTGLAMKAVDFDASRATATNPELGNYAIVHFATHGLTNSQHPELSGIVLSLFNERGEPQEGFLRLHDIYNLKLPVSLVVLSACNSGLGKDVRGEGLIGLTRGFMYSGAAGVVASLWKVDDDATAELMTRFYRGLIENRLTPAAALREAQLSMREQKRWRAPYYWAGFVIQGKYNERITLPVKTSTRWYLWVLGGICLLSSLFLAYIRLVKKS
ncbi:MAG TPA: CHAT domain-containing tetratricopeptide repeat protein [Pyrinomonadaceae bacterium]|nr:CHAT domain-containing tetratricopeptide repeat protein [Pyrinomonadaceae bacterium]